MKIEIKKKDLKAAIAARETVIRCLQEEIWRVKIQSAKWHLMLIELQKVLGEIKGGSCGR